MQLQGGGAHTQAHNPYLCLFHLNLLQGECVEKGGAGLSFIKTRGRSRSGPLLLLEPSGDVAPGFPANTIPGLEG